jgi:putative endonuclease
MPRMPDPAAPWYLYLLLCRNGAYYAGITNDLQARWKAHAAGTGARYTRANPPLRLLGSRPYPDRAAASRAEWAIKQLPRERKLAFLLDVADHAPAASTTEGEA